MEEWHRRAVEHFPQLHGVLDFDPSTYTLFRALRAMLYAAHDAEDTDLLRRIYDFAEWGARQEAQELWNAAGVVFYEHLFDNPAYSDEIIPWLSPYAVYVHWGLWEAMAPPDEWAWVRPLLGQKRVEGARLVRDAHSL